MDSTLTRLYDVASRLLPANPLRLAEKSGRQKNSRETVEILQVGAGSPLPWVSQIRGKSVSCGWMTTLGVFGALFDGIAGSCACVASTPPHNWTIPGGRVEPGESPVEALVREVREETADAFTGARGVVRVFTDESDTGRDAPSSGTAV